MRPSIVFISGRAKKLLLLPDQLLLCQATLLNLALLLLTVLSYISGCRLLLRADHTHHLLLSVVRGDFHDSLDVVAKPQIF
jgi:hypothetical protein